MDGLERMLKGMRDVGEAVSLGWDEDTDMWACSWTVGNQRFSVVRPELMDAVIDVQREAG